MTITSDPPTASLPEETFRPRRALRIGIVAPPFLAVPPVGYGGIERVVANLVDGLVEDGHQVTLFAAARSRTQAKLVTPLSVTSPLGGPTASADDLYHATAAYLHAEEFDLVHDHTGVGAALGAMLSGRVPVIHTLHGPWTELSRRFYALISERVHLVAISDAQRDENPTLRYSGVVHNGVQLETHPFNDAKEEFLVFVGRISPEKQPETAVEVARRSGLPLVMVVKRTEDAERRYWDEVVAPLIGDDVVVLDEPPHEVKVDIMGRARAMLFPLGWEEPFGLVMAEAMACGTPVIANPRGAAREVIADGVTGFLCADVEEMVAAVPAAAQLRPADCRARVAQCFSVRSMVEGYERIYQSVLSNARAGG